MVDQLKKYCSDKKKMGKMEALLQLKTCYVIFFSDQIISNWRKDSMTSRNEVLLDMVTDVQTLRWNEVIVSNHFSFGLVEWLEILHNDLSFSYIETDDIGGPIVLQSFRLPHNPYSMEPFSYSEIIKMLHQLFFKSSPATLLLLTRYPEVVQWSKSVKEFYHNEWKSRYDMSVGIQDMMEKRGLRFKKCIDPITKMNRSHWKDTKRGRDKLDYVMKSVFIPLFEHIFEK